MKPILVILAAGMGSRYGGLKQIDGVGPNGETLMDYSIYDALRTGFGKVVFIIRHDIERAFRESIADKYTGKIPVDYAFQELDILPAGFSTHAEREKPWGTGHAMLMTEELVDAPFCVINSDDFYGQDAFKVVSKFLQSSPAPNEYCMAGFKLSNTLSKHGSVARGICSADKDNCLLSVEETLDIRRDADSSIISDHGPLTGDELTSTNVWGFTPAVFNQFKAEFGRFLEHHADDPKAEFYIPTAINRLIGDGTASVKVLPTSSTWLGITYREDKPEVSARIATMVDEGVYPSPLW